MRPPTSRQEIEGGLPRILSSDRVIKVQIPRNGKGLVRVAVRKGATFVLALKLLIRFRRRVFRRL